MHISYSAVCINEYICIHIYTKFQPLKHLSGKLLKASVDRSRIHGPADVEVPSMTDLPGALEPLVGTVGA